MPRNTFHPLQYRQLINIATASNYLPGKLDSSSSIFQLPSNPISSALTEQSRSSSARSRLRRFSEVVNSFGDHYHFRSRVPFKSFDDCLQESRLLFSQTVPTIGGYSLRHHNDEATNGYRFLCLRGFVVQGSLDPKDRLLDDVFRFIDNIGWSYTVMHVHPFCPRVGCVFRFSPSVINQLMITPAVEHSFPWKDVVLKQAITHLTGSQCSGWTGFNLNALLSPFQVLYRVCELNWLPGSPDTSGMDIPPSDQAIELADEMVKQ
ncbi:hypothetical protein DY000_02007392 [Brassica cretica]|uniref:Uncharacterized protein n=1 Tax=Brassica cretica TaxID=69181 RepID=A0ABQ7BUM4_BRACR|nr:hypothetical protein DY000_02007392 [Brassica cretica]